MTPNVRLMVNTLAQNIRTVANICLSLYSTRLVLEILGQSDYGIYMLVAGVVSFLSFFTTAMITTTQRHLAYSHGKENAELSKAVFENSYIINILIGIALSLALASITSWLFNGTTLNIEPDKCQEAEWVYLIVLLSVFFTFVTSPFKALFIAHENIVYISIIETLDGFLKVAMVFCLYLFDTHRIVVYACIISLVMLMNFLAFALYAQKKYEESCIIPNLGNWNSAILKDLFGFTSWTIYGSVCVFLRSQGIAIMLNRAYGTFINAAYGISNQILGSITFLSSAIINAFTPQIIKAEGAGNRTHMLDLSQKACKYCYLQLAAIAIPLIFEMDSILELWLGKVPDNAAFFCRMFLVATVIDQITTGLNVTIQALGRIRNYTLIIYTIKLSTVVLVWLVLKSGFEIFAIMPVYIVIEALTTAIRLPYAAKTTGLNVNEFLHKVLWRIMMPTITVICVSYMIYRLPVFKTRFILTETVGVLVAMITIWLFSLNASEKKYIKSIVNKRMKKAKK